MDLLCKSKVVIEDCFGTFHSSRSGGSPRVLFAIRWSWHLTPIPACLLRDPLVLRMFSSFTDVLEVKVSGHCPALSSHFTCKFQCLWMSIVHGLSCDCLFCQNCSCPVILQCRGQYLESPSCERAVFFSRFGIYSEFIR